MVRFLMMDVDGVLVRGRTDGGDHWSAQLEADLGVNAEAFQREFFDVYWEDIVAGRSLLLDALTPVLAKIAPHVTAQEFLTYWFEQDALLDHELLKELVLLRAQGLRIYLATNQEHLRAAYLMNVLRLADYVDGIFYSATLGVRKPSKEFFQRVAATLEADAGELLLVDDSLANIRTAEALGWRVLHWPAENLSSVVLA